MTDKDMALASGTGLSSATEPEVSALRASIPSADALTEDEKSFLLYVETCCVDGGGMLVGERMNSDDHAAAKRFSDLGFLHFGRIPGALLQDGFAKPTHYAELTLAGWEMAWQLRRRLAERKGPYATSVWQHHITIERLASAMSASGQDPQGLEAKPASAARKGDATPQSSDQSHA